MVQSNYPGGLDVLLRLQDEFDRLDALAAQQIADGAYQVETTLGVKPADPNDAVTGTPWTTFTDIAAMLLELARVERGRFELDYPTPKPHRVNFASTGRFTDAAAMVVFCRRVNDTDGLQLVGASFDVLHSYSTRIQTSGGVPFAFDFYRYNMEHSVHSEGPRNETWEYMAIQESL